MNGYDTSLSGRRALVTGGGSGIGAAIAATMRTAGAEVRTCDVDGASGSDYVCDIADDAAVAAMFGRLEDDLGGLDICVNNVGVAGPTGPVEDMDPGDFDRCVRVPDRGLPPLVLEHFGAGRDDLEGVRVPLVGADLVTPHRLLHDLGKGFSGSNEVQRKNDRAAGTSKAVDRNSIVNVCPRIELNLAHEKTGTIIVGRNRLEIINGRTSVNTQQRVKIATQRIHGRDSIGRCGPG